MHGLGMQVLALNPSGGGGHALICINLGSSTSHLLWALQLTAENSTHFLRSILECFPHQCSTVTKKEQLSAWHFLAFKVTPKYFICYRIWNGMARKSCLQGHRMLLGHSGQGGAAPTVLSAGCAVSAGRPCWHLPLSPSRSLTELIQGTCPKENPIPCSAVPSMYHHVTHSTGALQTPQFSKQLLRTLPSSAALL